MSRKHWHSPQLTVLARSQPQEAVLLVCKESVNNISVSGPSKANSGCFDFTSDFERACPFCSTTASS